MTTYKELAERLEETMHDDAGFHLAVDEAIEILRSLDAQKPIGYWGGAFSIEGGADLYEVEQVSAFGRVYKNLPLYAAPVAAQPPSQPVDPVHVINTAIDVMMRRDATIAGVLFDFMGWLTTRKERLCLSSADDASPAVTAITEFAKMRNLSLDNAMVTDWQSGAAPQRPQWIGLTDSEIDSLQATTGARDDDIRIIEAALRAKNGVAA